MALVVIVVAKHLFDVGSDLCVPGEAGAALRLTAAYTTRLEGWIDAVNASLQPLTSFVLPGGRPAAAWLHMARTVCRRAERLVTELFEREESAREACERLRNRYPRWKMVTSRTIPHGVRLETGDRTARFDATRSWDNGHNPGSCLSG